MAGIVYTNSGRRVADPDFSVSRCRNSGYSRVFQPFPFSGLLKYVPLVFFTAFFLHASGGYFESRAQEGADAAPLASEQFGDWLLKCVKAGNGSACELVQPLMVEHEGQPVELLTLAVSRAADKSGKADWALVVLTPLDVDLPSDFGLQAGQGKPALFRYRNCNHLGCFAVVPLDKGWISQLQKAADGTAYFRLLNGRTVKVSFSLAGFTKGFEALASGKVPDGKAGEGG
ncbi:invasion associated locus B family protein [Pannonibacter sp. Pt2]|uniref:Invasion associated locus B family protein n=1 Tax=Pannonibacter anstelovis TaxID=3121537 RepID=A0ABU7ZMY1_9HYPH